MLAAMIIIFYYAIYPANGTVDSTVFCLVVYYKMKGNMQNKKKIDFLLFFLCFRPPSMPLQNTWPYKYQCLQKRPMAS